MSLFSRSTTEPGTEQSDLVVDQLQRLIQLNLDAEADCHNAALLAATRAPGNELSSSLSDLCAIYGRNATVLQDYVELNGKVPRTEGTIFAAILRICRELRSTIVASSDETLLREAVKGVHIFESAYQEIIPFVERSEIAHKLAEQLAEIREAQRRIESLERSAAL